MTYTKELAAFREAKAAMRRWDDNGGIGPAAAVTDAEDRLVQAAWALAEAVDAVEGGDPR